MNTMTESRTAALTGITVLGLVLAIAAAMPVAGNRVGAVRTCPFPMLM